MCLALPGQILEVTGETAYVDFGSTRQQVGRQLVPAAGRGDWVLVNTGQIISLITPDEAAAIRDLLREILTPEASP